MTVEDKEINGFLIDKFNQHNLEVGKTQGICPNCSHTRKPKNQKLKCASYDWERGLGTCHNCNTSFQLHTYQRKGSSEKTYVKPIDKVEDYNITGDPEQKVLKWFQSRGISAQTLIDLQVGEGTEWMPQTQKEENTIKFNYIMGGELVNIKYRDGRKKL